MSSAARVAQRQDSSAAIITTPDFVRTAPASVHPGLTVGVQPKSPTARSLS